MGLLFGIIIGEFIINYVLLVKCYINLGKVIKILEKNR